jgi:hypothetical protein
MLDDLIWARSDIGLVCDRTFIIIIQYHSVRRSALER